MSHRELACFDLSLERDKRTPGGRARGRLFYQIVLKKRPQSFEQHSTAPCQHGSDHNMNRWARLIPPYDGARARPVLPYREGRVDVEPYIAIQNGNCNTEEPYSVLLSGNWCRMCCSK